MTMRKDNITEVAKSDSIIRKVGEFYFSKHSRNQLRCKNFSSKHMRALATLLIKVREIDQSQNDFSFYLRPQKFDIIEQAAIAIAGGADGTCDNLEHPSTLKNIGYDIKHAVEIKEEVAITNHDLEKISEAKYFVKLYKRKWKLLSSSAIKQLEERTYNKKMVLPTCTELQVVINHMKTLLSEVARQGTVTSIKYRDVVELVQARLLLFNKRRPGELEALRVEDFEKRSNNDTVLSDVIQKTLTDLEKKLLDTHQVVTVRGKRGHAVPILIPPDCSDVMLMICDSNIRKDAGVKITNTYFFANTGDEVYRGVQSLQNVLRNCESSLDLTHVTASSLRKYLATNCQLLNLSDTELDWVVRHLGHSKLTHLSNYRLSSSTVERTKVAKLLVLLENGLLNEAQGNTLSDKELDDLILKKIGQTDRSVDSPDEEDEDDDCKQPIRTTAINKRQLTDTDTEVGDNTEQAVKRVRTKQKMKGDQDDDHGEESQSEQSSHTASEYSESSEESYEDDDDEDNTLPKKGKTSSEFVFSNPGHIKYVCCWLNHIYKLDCSREQVLELDASTDKKFSRHLVFLLPTAAFKDNQHVGNFVLYIFGKLSKYLKRDSGALLSNSNSDVKRGVENWASGEDAPSEGFRQVTEDKPVPIGSDPSSDEGKKEDKAVTPEKTPDDLPGRPPSKSPDKFTQIIDSFGLQDLETLFVKNKHQETVLFCDTGVYTKNRNFRLFLSSKLKKNNPLVVSPDNCFRRHPKATREQVFLDSLISNVTYNSGLKILTFDTNKRCRNGKTADICISAPQKVPGFLEGYQRSPYPEIDEFMSDQLTRGRVHGSIRHWTYFSQGELLVYDVAHYRWCGNVQRHHKSNNIMLIADLLQGVYYQKCHDPECRAQNYKSPDCPLPDHVLPAYYFRDGEEEFLLMDDTEHTPSGKGGEGLEVKQKGQLVTQNGEGLRQGGEGVEQGGVGEENGLRDCYGIGDCSTASDDEELVRSVQAMEERALTAEMWEGEESLMTEAELVAAVDRVVPS